jgi:PAS domain S-box-containing protein
MSRSHPDSPFSGRTRLRTVTGYLYAVVVPWLAAYLAFQLDALRGMRLALNFAAIVAAATFFGAGPAMVATVVSIVAFNRFFAPVPLAAPVSTPADSYLRSGVVLVTGALIALILRQRHAVERQLRATLARQQEQAGALIQAQQASNSAAWTFTVADRRTHWYEGGAEIFGRPHAEITALGSPTSLVLPEDLPRIAAAAERTMRDGEPFVVEFRVRWPNGEVHWLEARGVPLASNPKIWRGATIDVTQRKRAEEALIRTEKLAVAGRLAASIAHEINNPLEAVTNLLYLARLTAANPESQQYIETAEAELARVAHITSQTLRFHRQQTAAVETDLADAARSILGLYHHRLSQAGIEVRFDAEPAEPIVCFAGEIRQVLANLIANAIDAMPYGGSLRVSLRPGTDWRTGCPGLRLSVADTGHGMSAETRRRIYEPFYTTRGEVGTGLGLWVTAGIVEKHKGTLQVRSATTPGASGTAFMLVLPYASPASEGIVRREVGVAVTA